MTERDDIERVDADLRRVGEAADGLVRSAQELRASLDGLAESVRAAVRAASAPPVAASVPVEPASVVERTVEEPAGGVAAPTPTAMEPDLDAARIVALNMALDGKSRDEVAAYLRDELGVADSAGLLDDVYSRVG
jgi:hypothetical protein